MECYEVTSATGEGFWGKIYRFKLIQRQRQYTSRFGQQQRALIDYGLYFQEPTAKHWDRRIFALEEERAAFIAHSITDLQLTSLSGPSTQKVEYFLAGLVGESLSSVTFVMDYLQMEFNGYRFNFYNWPVLYENQDSFTQDKDIYYHKLVTLIGQTVKAVDEYLDIGLGIEFESGSLLSIPLRVGENFETPEIVEYHGPDNQWMIWSVGEHPFEIKRG
jgi:hypothetical protein